MFQRTREGNLTTKLNLTSYLDMEKKQKGIDCMTSIKGRSFSAEMSFSTRMTLVLDVILCNQKKTSTWTWISQMRICSTPITLKLSVKKKTRLMSRRIEETIPNQPDEVPAPVVSRRSERVRQCPDYYGTWVNTAKEQGAETATVIEAMSSPQKKKWKEAMRKEMKSIKANKVWELVKLPKGKKTIGWKRVYKGKTHADGSLETYKARLVAKGYSQQHVLDYDETFSPVARFESLRTLLALAVQDGLRVHHMDVTTAFLNGELKEEVYMDQPEEFQVQGKEDQSLQTQPQSLWP